MYFLGIHCCGVLYQSLEVLIGSGHGVGGCGGALKENFCYAILYIGCSTMTRLIVATKTCILVKKVSFKQFYCDVFLVRLDMQLIVEELPSFFAFFTDMLVIM